MSGLKGWLQIIHTEVKFRDEIGFFCLLLYLILVFTSCLIYSDSDYEVFTFPTSIRPAGKPISPPLTLLGLHLQQVMMLHVLLIIISADHYTQRFQDNHKGIPRHSTGATPPVSVNVAEWVRGAVLISKRAEVTLLHSSSGPLSLIANRVSMCR